VAIAALSASVLTGTLAPPVGAQPVLGAALGATAAAPTLSWRACRDGFECARLQVPLDYDQPEGQTISLAVIRLPAAQPDQRIGSLFLNPGGPGGSGVDIARGLAPFLPLELRGKFDIVGFDPRGIERSTPLRCYASFDDLINDLPPIAFPRTTREENRWIASDRLLAAACKGHAGPILNHMSTADVARDMDLLREAMGDAQLSYFGYSYGSMLGQTYANLFPTQTRALVIDGVIDPEGWAGAGRVGNRVPFGTRVRSAQGSGATLRAFFRLCDAAGRQCAFSGDARQRFHTLAAKLKKDPIDFGFGFRFTYNDLIGTVLGALYAPFFFPDLAFFLRDIERESANAPRSLARLRAHMGLALARQERYPNFIESLPGVACADGNNPHRYGRYRTSADQATADFGHFGRLWNWQGSVCAIWPGTGEDQYLGPWDAATPNPVLVVGNFFDPATPYSGAQAASRLLPNSRLLSYAGWGHTAFFSGNFCVDAAVTSYLVTTVPPAEGTVCRPAGSPFGQARAQAAARPVELLAQTMPDAVRRAVSGRR
jgi:pimeloyl-ACP methyl ester carboxylesterase